jgi:hypothetical protein
MTNTASHIPYSDSIPKLLNISNDTFIIDKEVMWKQKLFISKFLEGMDSINVTSQITQTTQTYLPTLNDTPRLSGI